MSYRSRVGTGFVLAMAVVLMATACGSRKATPTTQADGPSTSSSPDSSNEPASASEPTQIDPSSGTDGQPQNNPRPNSSPPPVPVPKVTVKFSDKNNSEVFTPNCPYRYAVFATITTTGPVDLTYQFWHGKFPNLDAAPLHFAAAGSKIVTNTIQIGVATPTVFDDSVVVKGPGGLSYQDGGVFTLACIPGAGAVTASPARTTCPYLTTFSVTVSVALGPQTSQYKWTFEDGSELKGTLTFPGTGPQSQVVTVKRKVQLGSTGVSASFLPDEHSTPNGTAPATATCF